MLDEIPANPVSHTLLKKKILLAEDDNSMRRFVGIVLRQAGYEVIAAEDGLEAMQIALEDVFDAVVTDVVMPNFSGYDLCRSVRANSNQNKIYCILLSGLKNENSAEDSSIADAFVIKDGNLKKNLLDVLESFFPKQIHV